MGPRRKFLYSIFVCQLVFVFIRVHPQLQKSDWGFSLEHPQGIGIVGIVGIEFTGSQLNPNFCHPKPKPTTLTVFDDKKTFSYLKERKEIIYKLLPYKLLISSFIFSGNSINIILLLSFPRPTLYHLILCIFTLRQESSIKYCFIYSAKADFFNNKKIPHN